MTEAHVRTHIHTLEPGDRFRFEAGGPVYKRVNGPDERIWIQDEAGKLPVHRIDPGQCYVLALDPFARETNG